MKANATKSIRYIHHEKEDMPTRNTEQHWDPTREIGQIPRCPPGPPTAMEGTYSEKEETSWQ
jgi:hypothetical protein